MMDAVVQASIFWDQADKTVGEGAGAEQLLEEDFTGRRTDGLWAAGE